MVGGASPETYARVNHALSLLENLMVDMFIEEGSIRSDKSQETINTEIEKFVSGVLHGVHYIMDNRGA